MGKWTDAVEVSLHYEIPTLFNDDNQNEESKQEETNNEEGV